MTRTQLTQLGRQWLKLVDNCKTREDLLEMFEELNFFRATSSSEAFLSCDKNYVVKFPYICNDSRGLPPLGIPTYEASLPDKKAHFYHYNAHVFMVQPLADTSTAAIEKFKKLTKKNNERDLGEDTNYDCEHRRNVGIYKGKPVVYDW
jgi:hypothetical protein